MTGFGILDRLRHERDPDQVLDRLVDPERPHGALTHLVEAIPPNAQRPGA